MMKQALTILTLFMPGLACQGSPSRQRPAPPVQPSAAPGRGAPSSATQAQRRLSFNGRALTAAQERNLAQVEARIGFRFPDGAYWYDSMTGAAGPWGGPAGGFLPAGLPLGGPMPANCSGGGTGVFINGRELHREDVLALVQIFGTALPGRYWMDSQGNLGLEGGPVLVNLFVLAQQLWGGSFSGGGGASKEGVLSTYDKAGAYVIPH